jgi:hypothetical protein
MRLGWPFTAARPHLPRNHGTRNRSVAAIVQMLCEFDSRLLRLMIPGAGLHFRLPLELEEIIRRTLGKEGELDYQGEILVTKVNCP